MPAGETAHHPFPATRWSIVARAARSSADGSSHEALELLCRSYWFPLYAFARRRGAAPEDAEDLTQSFFSKILHGDFFAQADQSRGKMRSLLLGSFSNHMANARRDAGRMKRGGSTDIVSIDVAFAEGKLMHEPRMDSTLEEQFERHWALSVIDSAMTAMAGDYAERGKEEHFEALKLFLEGGETAGSYESAAAQLGLVVTAVRQEVYRMRQKFRAQLRKSVADTLNEPTEESIEDELGALKRILRR